jgi:hypothetical protein
MRSLGSFINDIRLMWIRKSAWIALTASLNHAVAAMQAAAGDPIG